MEEKEKVEDKKECVAKVDKEVKEGIIFAILAYFSILCLVPLILKRDNKFAIHHGKQGLVLFIWLVAASLLFWIPILGQLIFFISFICIVCISVVGIVQVLMSKYWKIPVIYGIASKMTIP